MNELSSYWSTIGRTQIHRRRLLRAGTSIAASGLSMSVLAACSSKKSGAPVPTVRAGSRTTATAAPASAAKVLANEAPLPSWSKRLAWEDPGPPVRGQTISLAGADPVTLDVSQSLGSAPIRAVSYIYEKLLWLRGDWWEDTAVIPGLAESYEQPDNSSIILHLRNNVRYHNAPPVNGRQLTSADVGWNIDYDQKKALLRHWGTTQKWSTPDSTTIRIDLASPYSALITEIADVHNVMFPREVFERDGDFSKTAIGTGPFMLGKYEPKVQVSWKRNPDYWRMGADGKPLPYADAVDQFIFADVPSSIAALEAGRLAGGFGAGLLPADGEPLSQRQSNLLIPIGPWMNGLWMIFNLTQPHWKDDRVRKAALLAMDQQRIIDTVFLGKGLWQGGMPAAITDFSWSQDKLKQAFKPDPQKAKQLLDAAGATGLEVTSTGPYNNDIEQVGQSMLNAAGFKVSLNPQQYAEHYAALQSGKFDFFIYKVDWISYDPDYWTYGSFHSGDPHNYARISDPVLDKMLENQRGEFDHDRRKAIVDDITQYVLVDKAYIGPMPVHFAYHPQQPWLKNKPTDSFSHENIGVEHAWIKH